jgi:two-component sensor histidine kinase
LHIGLALHELAVNSVSYGALSRPGGFVTVSTDLTEQTDGGVFLSLSWSESIGAPELDQAMRGKSFASVTLERIVPTSLNGSATLEFADGQLEYKLVIPHGQFEVD